MLILTRRVGEIVVIGDDVTTTLLVVKGNQKVIDIFGNDTMTLVQVNVG